jgi:shikimate 5-dehydrogenase
VLILGAGAMGRAAATEALSMGCKELWIGNRTQDNAWSALEKISSTLMRGRSHSFNLIKPSPKVPKQGIIINTLPCPARGSDTAQIDWQRYDSDCLYLDLIPTPTLCREKAAQRGMQTADGKLVIAKQVQRHCELLTGGSPDLEIILWAVAEAYQASTSGESI